MAARPKRCSPSTTGRPGAAKKIREYLADQRDMYAFLDSQTLRLTNQGLAPTEVSAELASLSPRLAQP
jgi:alkyl sulfatase BDS1-like metallo-beta-lactamase superfamily hydrolase